MCIFTNDKDIPAYVRLSTRTLQYLVIPLLSIAIIAVGSHHLHDCPAQPLLPVWHIVAGCSGIMVPLLYLIFDKLNPWLARQCPLLSELMDNAIVFIIPVYILFEVAWLITGSVWVIYVDTQTEKCDATIYVFSLVVIINFWIHLLTPLFFTISVCCSRIFPFIGYCTYWNIIKNAVDMWTFRFRFLLSVFVSFPLSAAMIGIGINGINVCRPANQEPGDADYTLNSTDTIIDDEVTWSLSGFEYLNIPVWLITSGTALFLLPAVYTVYDKFCKPDCVEDGCKLASKCFVIVYLLFAMACALVGFLWIFGTQIESPCNKDSDTYKFAFASLICLNVLMDVWICVKISIVLYWALLSEDT